MKELCRVAWFGLRKDGYKLGRYYDPEEPDAAFEVEVAVPGLAAHRAATIRINGAEIGRRSNVQAAMNYAEWVLQHRRRGDFRRRLDDSPRPAYARRSAIPTLRRTTGFVSAPFGAHDRRSINARRKS